MTTLLIIFGSIFGLISLLMLFVLIKLILVKAALDETIIAIFKQQEKMLNAANILNKSIEGFDRVLNGFNDTKTEFRKSLNQLNTEIKLVKDSTLAFKKNITDLENHNKQAKKNEM